ncbi:hypothetical protein RRF57_006457 [Xylaria bambusicola]|uniref:Uncharacterized protein n=1 Tax=Xylaria bambusicola TaxID=326684 RepID=A0AAN7Z6T4_9PEZI
MDDRRRLKEELGIRTVIDLRSKTEHLSQAQKRQADLKIPAHLQSNAALAEPMQIPGLIHREVQVTGRRLERALLRQLSWWDFMCVSLIPHYLLINSSLVISCLRLRLLRCARYRLIDIPKSGYQSTNIHR